MPVILVNESLCDRCNTCARGCILGILEPAAAGAVPHTRPEMDAYCLKCGHCEALCPKQALVLDFLRDQKLAAAPADATLDPDALLLHMKFRRSVREFKPEPVPRETLERLLDAARYAASGGNQQPVRWLALADAAQVRKVAALTVDWMRTLPGTDHPLAPYVEGIVATWDAGADQICHGAPHLLFATIPRTGALDDVTEGVIAMTHVDLAAPALGLGTCWAGFVKMACDGHAPLREALGLPGDRMVACAMLYGVPRHRSTCVPRRNPLELNWR